MESKLQSRNMIASIACVIMAVILQGTQANRRHGRCTEPSNMRLDFQDRLRDRFYNVPPLSGTVANMSSIPLEFQHVRRSPLTGHKECPTWENAVRLHGGNVCPFHYVLNTDHNRIPRTMVETQCNCQECVSAGGQMSGVMDCQPIRYYTKVFRRGGCDENGVYVYQAVWEEMRIGCRCGIAATRTAGSHQLRSPE